jgi:hypothetical protein
MNEKIVFFDSLSTAKLRYREFNKNKINLFSMTQQLVARPTIGWILWCVAETGFPQVDSEKSKNLNIFREESLGNIS